MKTIKINNHPSILRASTIEISEGLQPHRMVLRKNGDEYITHRENLEPIQNGDVLEFQHRDFYWGHYFSSLEAAIKDFEDRVK